MHASVRSVSATTQTREMCAVRGMVSSYSCTIAKPSQFQRRTLQWTKSGTNYNHYPGLSVFFTGTKQLFLHAHLDKILKKHVMDDVHLECAQRESKTEKESSVPVHEENRRL